MFEHLGRFAFRRRRWILGSTVGVIVAAVVWGMGVFDALVGGGGVSVDPTSQSARAQAWADEQLGRDTPDVIVLYSSDTLTVDDPNYREVVESDLAGLPTDVVERATTTWSASSPAMISADRRSTIAILQLHGTSDEAREDAFVQIRPDLEAAPPGLTVQLGGSQAMGADIGDQVEADIAKAEMISLPLLLFLLMIVFGGLVAAGLPLAIGGLAILASFTLIRLITLVTDVSIFSINVVTMLGLGLAIDYALFVVSRFREELRGRDVESAVVATVASAGRTVAFSGLTVAISLGSLLLFPQMFLRSMAFGGIAAVLMAMIASITVLPALLAVTGTRIDRLKIPLRRRDLSRHRRPDPGFWSRTAHAVMRRPIYFVVVLVPVLLLLGVPFLGVNFGTQDHRVLPEGAESRVVAERMQAEFPDVRQDDLYSVITFAEPVSSPTSTAQLEAYRSSVLELPGVASADVTGVHENTARISIQDEFDGQSDAAKTLVDEVRALPSPDDASVLVGGATPELVDMLSSLAAVVPWMLVWMVCATLVLLFVAFGSVVLPIKAVVMNALSLTASFGAIVWIFQDGHLSDALGFTVTGSVDSAQPILMLAIAFGLSMDYEVFLLSRIRDAWVATGDNASAVANGLQRTGSIITSAALLLIVVFAAFATSGVTFIKMVGLGMALAILIDATVVRSFLVPASMALLGRRNWWAPAPLARWWQRFGFRDTDSTEVKVVQPVRARRRHSKERREPVTATVFEETPVSGRRLDVGSEADAGAMEPAVSGAG